MNDEGSHEHSEHEIRANGPFVGRSRESARLEQLIDGGARLITITGPAGIGKSRLVREYLRGRDEARGTSRVLDLATDADLAESVDAALRSDDAPAHFVLDNADLALEAAVDAARRWLSLPERPTVVLTSRESLGIPSESRLVVHPLDRDRAVELYVTLARRARGEDGDEEAPHERIVELVERLDRNPLAIELAASRAATLAADQLAERLPDDIQLLRRRKPPADSRHASLEEAIDWSSSRLDDALREVLHGCAIFERGFDLHAASNVLDGDVATHLDALVHKSWLRTDGTSSSHTRRFVIPRLQRAYLQRKARNDDTVDAAVATHHLHYFADQCDKRLEHRHTTEQAADDLDWLLTESANIESATRCALDREDWMRAATLMLASDLISRCKGPVESCFERMTHVLDEAAGQLGAETTCRLLSARGEWHKRQGRLEESLADLYDAQSRADDSGDWRTSAWLGLRAADLLRAQSRYPAAQEKLNQAAGVLEEHEAPQLQRDLHAYRAALLVDTGDFEGASDELAELVHLPRHPELFREFECLRSQIYARFHLGDNSALSSLSKRLEQMLEARPVDRLQAAYWRLRGDAAYAARKLDEAADFYLDAMEVFAEIGEDFLHGVIAGSLGGVELLRQRVDAALACYETSLELHRRLESHVQTGQLLLGVAALHHEQGRHELADVHYRESAAVIESVGAPVKMVAWGSLLHGWNLIERDQPERTCTTLEQALEKLESAGTPAEHVVFQLSLAIAHQRAGRDEDASATRAGIREDVESSSPSKFQLYEDALSQLYALGRDPGDESALRAARELLKRLDDADDPDAAESLRGSFAFRVLISWLRREVETVSGSPNDEPSRVRLEVGREALWFRVDGGRRVDIARRQAPRRILAALAEHHREAPGQELTVNHLFAVGWPETEILAESARNRVYWAVYTLRNLGLEGIIQTSGEGYILAPDAAVVHVDGDSEV